MDDFAAIKARCDGMLRPETYAEVFKTALETKGRFLEIGTAHGAATVCLGLAMDGGLTVDRFKGGSRDRYPGDSHQIARANLDHYGLLGKVDVFAGDADRAQFDGPISLLMLDCDGRIDRDLLRFGKQIVPGAPVIIDDCLDKVRVKKLDGGKWRIDQKHRITALLVDVLTAHGLLAPRMMSHHTWFGIWTGVGEWPADHILSAYRQLVFATGSAK